MSKKSKCPSWRIPDGLWKRMEGFLPKYRKSRWGGRPRLDLRKVMNGIFYVLRTGCQWKAAPREFGSGSSLHRYFQEFARRGVFRKLWKYLLRRYDELRGIQWTWQSLDGSMTKAPLGGEKTGRNPTDRGKLGVKRSVLTDGRGVPLGVAVAGANVHDQKLFAATLGSIPVRRPKPTARKPQHLCCDKGFDADTIRRQAKRRCYRPHIRSRGEEQVRKRRRGGRARRWVVERIASWMNRFRRILVRWEKKSENYLAMLHLTFTYITWRQTKVLG